MAHNDTPEVLFSPRFGKHTHGTQPDRLAAPHVLVSMQLTSCSVGETGVVDPSDLDGTASWLMDGGKRNG